ncbi:Uncharacterised protein [Sphingobacterium daejeonense]|nr:Uncharacterised protein [Sphingobacterium daejeonense]
MPVSDRGADSPSLASGPTHNVKMTDSGYFGKPLYKLYPETYGNKVNSILHVTWPLI